MQKDIDSSMSGIDCFKRHDVLGVNDVDASQLRVTVHACFTVSVARLV